MRSFICNELEPLAYLIYLVAVLLCYHRFKLLKHKVLLFYYAGTTITMYAGIVITTYLNNWSYNLVYFASICVFSWYFRQLLHSRQKQIIVTICFIINVLIFIYFDIIQHTFYSRFNSLVYGVAFITIVLYTLLYLHQTMTDVKEENLLMNFDFWLVCLYLMYFLGSFVVVIYYERANIYERAYMWAMSNVILFICAVIIFTASLRIIKKQQVIYD